MLSAAVVISILNINFFLWKLENKTFFFYLQIKEFSGTLQDGLLACWSSIKPAWLLVF